MAGLGRSIRNRLGGRQGGLTYEVEVVAEHAGRLAAWPTTCGTHPPPTAAGAPSARLQAQSPSPLRPPPAAVELPLPPGTRAQFVLKRRNRLCLTEPEPVGGGGACEWNTRCTQVGLG